MALAADNVIPFSPRDLVIHNGEPRLLDLRLAIILEYKEPRAIRKLIQRKINELVRYGEVCATVAQTGTEDGGNRDAVSRFRGQRGPTGNEFLLNEGQSLLICALSETPKSADGRELIIKGFMEYRRGKLAQVSPSGDAAANPFNLDAEAVRVVECKLQMVNTAARIFGNERARAVWQQMGLATPPEPETGGQFEARQCLDRVLTAPCGSTTAGRMLVQAMDDDAAAADALKAIGIWAEPGRDGFVIANRHPELHELFADTLWHDYRWCYTLRRLLGAMPVKPRKFEPGRATRGVFIPATYLDLKPLDLD